jgi:hypothetical protein
MPIGAYPPATVSNCASMLPDLGHEGLATVWTPADQKAATDVARCLRSGLGPNVVQIYVPDTNGVIAPDLISSSRAA